jgi:hypothetical protein
MDSSLPVVGGALATAQLSDRTEWLCSADRDLELTDPLSNVFFETDWQATAREAARVLSGHAGRRGAHAPFNSVPIDAPDVRVAAVVRDRLYQSLEFVALTGGSHLVLHSPFLYFGTAQAIARGADLTDKIAKVRENLAPVVERAVAQNCVLVIENIFDLRPEPLDALVSSFASPFVRRSLDTGHANLMRPRGAPPLGLWRRHRRVGSPLPRPRQAAPAPSPHLGNVSRETRPRPRLAQPSRPRPLAERAPNPGRLEHRL